MKVDVIHSYGDKPDADEIEKSIEDASEAGYELSDKQCYGVQYAERRVLHVVILYFKKPIVTEWSEIQ